MSVAVVGVALGFLADVALAASGTRTFTPPASLTLGFIVIAALLFAFGWPIRQAQRGKRARPIDPFAAMRVVSLAKACAIVSALLGGAGLGLLGYVLTRSVLPQAGGIWLVASAVGGTVLVLVAALLVESWCRLPPEDPADTAETDVMRR